MTPAALLCSANIMTDVPKSPPPPPRIRILSEKKNNHRAVRRIAKKIRGRSPRAHGKLFTFSTRFEFGGVGGGWERRS